MCYDFFSNSLIYIYINGHVTDVANAGCPPINYVAENQINSG